MQSYTLYHHFVIVGITELVYTILYYFTETLPVTCVSSVHMYIARSFINVLL